MLQAPDQVRGFTLLVKRAPISHLPFSGVCHQADGNRTQAVGEVTAARSADWGAGKKRSHKGFNGGPLRRYTHKFRDPIDFSGVPNLCPLFSSEKTRQALRMAAN